MGNHTNRWTWKKIMVNYFGSHTRITNIQDISRNKLCLYCFSNGTINFAYRLKYICHEVIDLRGNQSISN